MSDDIIIEIPKTAAEPLVNPRQYEQMYAESINDPLSFWREQGQRVDWIVPFTHVRDVSYDAKDLHIRWYHDGTLNASVNCLDRHLETRAAQTAIIWEGDDPKDSKHVTYAELHEMTCRMANVLTLLGVKNAVARRALGQIGLSGVAKALVGPSTLAFGGEGARVVQGGRSTFFCRHCQR